MKSTKKKSLLNKTKTAGQQQDLVIVKTESDVQEDSHPASMYGDGLNIQIKEEPHSQEICEVRNGEPSSCSDTKADIVTSGSEVNHQQQHIKEECDSVHVKVEPELWLKEEKDSEGEEEEGKEQCPGRGNSLSPHWGISVYTISMGCLAVWPFKTPANMVAVSQL